MIGAKDGAGDVIPSLLRKSPLLALQIYRDSG
jgi:hypothetical protein